MRSIRPRVVPSSRHACLACLVCSAVGLAAGNARAQEPPRFSLEWQAPPGCPDSAAMRARVDALLGAAAGTLVRTPLDVGGTVTSGGPGATLRLQTDSAGVRGERTLEGATCDEVSSAGALVIALAIDPQAVEAHRSTAAPDSTPPVAAFEQPAAAPPPAPTPAAPPAPAAPLPPPAQAPAPPQAGPELEGHLTVALAVDVGTLPKATLGAGVGGGFTLGRGRFELLGSYFLPRFAEASSTDEGKGAYISLAALSAVACYAILVEPVEVSPCGTFEGGVLVAEGDKFQRRSKTAYVRWLAAGAGVEARVPVGQSLALRGAVGAIAPLQVPSVYFQRNEDDFEFYETSVVSFRGLIALVMSL